MRKCTRWARIQSEQVSNTVSNAEEKEKMSDTDSLIEMTKPQEINLLVVLSISQTRYYYILKQHFILRSDFCFSFKSVWS